MTAASRMRATPRGLPEELVVWEILVRLPPKSLLRCRAVCRAWRHATSTRPFLQAHHGRQPCLPIVHVFQHHAARHETFLSFNHKAATDDAQLQPIFRLEHSFYPEASCDGLLILSNNGADGGTCFSVCNPATRQHAPLRQLSGFSVFAMYKHRPTDEYRLFLHRTLADQVDCYVFVLGSDHPPRYIGGPQVAATSTLSTYLAKPAMVHACLHWYPVHYGGDPQRRQAGSKVVILFDTTSESFRRMRAPDVPAKSCILEMDGTLGIYHYDDTRQIVDIWMLRDYESEVWSYEYSVGLPAREIKCQFGGWLNDRWYASVHSVDGDVLLLVDHGGWMFHVDSDGKLVDNFNRDGQYVCSWEIGLKQTLVPHTFFTVLEGYAVNASPFV